MTFMDLYELLNVASDADVPTIERAFRELSLTLHQDKANVSTIPFGRVETQEEGEAREKQNHERYVKVMEARDTLTNLAKRKQYDLERANNRLSNKGSSTSDSKPSEFGTRSAFTDSSGFNTPCPYQKRNEGSKPQRMNDSPTSPGRRLDIELGHNSHVNNLDNLVIQLTTMRSAVDGTVRILPSAPSYPDYLTIVSSLSNATTMTTEVISCIKDARDLHLSDLNSATARELYRSAIADASTHRNKVQTLIRELQSKLGLPLRTRYSSMRAAFTRLRL
ncbi:hypothetical protein F4678DRAFT_485606 [Xylaria arbuscula]|nr:hypothetical protein F4678DRAFT_485606 [Xylaria arbuscula]